MITKQTLAVSKCTPPLDGTVMIMNEMDRLLNEMKDTLNLIKRILNEDGEGEVQFSYVEDGKRHRPMENIIAGS